MRYSTEEKCFMFDIYRQTGSVTKALRRYRLQFPGRRAPSKKMFYRLKKKFFETGSLNRKKTVRPKTVLTEETEINILAYLRANPQNSLNHVVGELPVSIGSAHAVTKKYKFHPYKVKRVQKLTPAQKEMRLQFSKHILEIIQRDATFLDKILWTDESSFSTSRGCHRQNRHYWSDANPYQIQEIQFQGRQSVSVWCGLIGERVLEPIIFDGSLTGQVYLNFLEVEIEERIDNLPLALSRHLIWQQDGAPPHNVVPVKMLLDRKYTQWIGKSGTIRWPPNSPDLTPCDFFLWGHVKNIVYSTPCYSLDDLKMRIRNAIRQVQNNRATLLKIKGHTEKVYIKCVENGGGQVEQHL